MNIRDSVVTVTNDIGAPVYNVLFGHVNHSFFREMSKSKKSAKPKLNYYFANVENEKIFLSRHRKECFQTPVTVEFIDGSRDFK